MGRDFSLTPNLIEEYIDLRLRSYNFLNKGVSVLLVAVARNATFREIRVTLHGQVVANPLLDGRFYVFTIDEAWIRGLEGHPTAALEVLERELETGVRRLYKDLDPLSMYGVHQYPRVEKENPTEAFPPEWGEVAP